MTCKTVKQLKEYLDTLPDEMPVKGYRSDGNTTPVSFFVVDYSKDDPNTELPKTLLIDVD